MAYVPLRTSWRHLLAATALSLAPIHAAAASSPGAIATAVQPLIAEALQNNPEIQAARNELEAITQRVAPAGALDDPMLEAGLVSVPTDSFRLDREDMTMKMIGVSQRFPYPGKRGLREELAGREAEAARHAYQETANRVARDLRVAYFDLGLVLATTALTEKNKTVIGQFLHFAESRYQVGQGSQADVLKAHTQLARMTDELLKLARERPMLEAEINRTLGRGIGAAAPVPAAAELRDVTLHLPGLHDEALRARPQLLALDRVIARNEKALQLARLDYYPDFDVRFSYGQRDNAPDGMKRSDLVTLTVAINLPVWQARKRDPKVAEAQAMLGQATMMRDVSRNELAAKLRQQVAAAEQSGRSARLYQKDILPQARLTVEAALAAYRVGRVDFMTLLDNQMTVFNTEIALASAVTGLHKALAEIDFLTGKPAQ